MTVGNPLPNWRLDKRSAQEGGEAFTSGPRAERDRLALNTAGFQLRGRRMALGRDDIFEARVHLANACRIANRDGGTLGGEVEGAVRRLARVMREAGALPEQMVIAVKDSLRMGGAEPAQTARYGEHTVKCGIIENLVTSAIDEYYASEAPAATLGDRGRGERIASPTGFQTGY